MQTGQNPGQTKSPQPTFDVVVCEKLRDAFQPIINSHPEVAALACTISWKGALNSAQIHHGIWLGENGLVGEPEVIFGSIYQTLKMLDEQCGRALEFVQMLKEDAVVAGTEAAKRHEELKSLEEKIRQVKAGVSHGQGGSAQPGTVPRIPKDQ